VTAAARAGGLTALAGALLAGSLTVASGPAPAQSPGSTVAPAGAVPLAGLPANRPVPDPKALAGRLAGLLADPALGGPALGGPAGLVVDALTGQVLFEQRAGAPASPASTLKTAVAAAALRTFSASNRLTTRVVYLPPAGAAGAGTHQGGTLWLVGAGDPTLTADPHPAGYPASLSAKLSDLAAQVHAAGIAKVDRVIGDSTLFQGPATAQGWNDTYVGEGDVTPVSALEVDGGRPTRGALGPRTRTPDAAAAAAFASALRAAGVTVGGTGVGTANPAAKTVASASSPPIPVLVERMLTDSDNDIAESLGRLVARARGLPPTFAGASAAVGQTLAQLGVDTAGMSLADVSGLSVNDLITPKTIVTILRTATMPAHPELRPLITGLPIAGFSGTLGDRYDDAQTAAGAGDVRAKTGSLRTVTSLAGELVDADGRLLLFGFFAPVNESKAAKESLDRVATALAGCGCSAVPTGPAAGTGAISARPSAGGLSQAAGPAGH
jgi:D-alanyl-D-alanine carboxypeptidase/D-alanyl-D-alanine-endopeptidase (penicillin-binding protein 4)